MKPLPIAWQCLVAGTGIGARWHIKCRRKQAPEREFTVTLDVSRPPLREVIRGLSILWVVHRRQARMSILQSKRADGTLNVRAVFGTLCDCGYSGALAI